MAKAGGDGRRPVFETKKGLHKFGDFADPCNLYLHHVLDLWAEAWRKKVAHGM